MSEDERYRTSTQYRLWSFSPSSLRSLRETTNRIAADRVREAVRRAREAQAQAQAISSNENSEAENGKSASDALPEGEVDCLTAEEELKLLRHYCRQTIQLSDHLQVPLDVKATAVQYLKRFYLTNSLMTYSPPSILKTALFFSTKTENHYFRITKFASMMDKTSPEDVLASEFLLTQGLRFTFDVRHPFRALEGAVMEILAWAHSPSSTPLVPGQDNFAEPVQKILATVPPSLEKRTKDAHTTARAYLKTSALLTDVYFHYTPSQIMLSALYLSDPTLTTWYITSKSPPSSTFPSPSTDKILATIEACATMLSTIPPSSEPSSAEKAELKALGKKLRRCRNPEKVDLVALQRAKREGSGGELGGEKAGKKRKVDGGMEGGGGGIGRLKQEGEDLFGPGLIS